MLFVIDVGNTNTVLGIYQGDDLAAEWRIRTQKGMTADEFYATVHLLFKSKGVREKDFSHTIVSCVVPIMARTIDEFCQNILGHEPIWVNSETPMGMPILMNNPAEVGADRLVNAVAAHARYPENLVVIDFGTATTFDCISAAGEYLGGAISPGIGIASDALFSKASKLPRVELIKPPATAIGKDTVRCMQSGIIFGYASLVDGMVERIRAEMNPAPRVIATGGLAVMMAGVCKAIEKVEMGLTLEGLKIIFDRL